MRYKTLFLPYPTIYLLHIMVLIYLPTIVLWMGVYMSISGQSALMEPSRLVASSCLPRINRPILFFICFAFFQ